MESKTVSPTISKTQQYRKVMKPMLERKRRARINKCLDQLKDLIIECMKEDDEHILKLEKADILEHTVEYLRKVRKNEKNTAATIGLKNSNEVKESFRNGYIHAANEVSKILATTRGVNTNFGIELMSHLGHKMNNLSSSIVIEANQRNQHQQMLYSEFQQSHYYQEQQQQQQQRSYSPVSSGYHSNLSSPVPSEDSSSMSDYQNHPINQNINKEEIVWRPW